MKHTFTFQGASLTVETSSEDPSGAVTLQVSAPSFKESFSIRPQFLTNDLFLCLLRLSEALGTPFGSFEVGGKSFRVRILSCREGVVLYLEGRFDKKVDFPPIRDKHLRHDLDIWLQLADEHFYDWKLKSGLL